MRNQWFIYVFVAAISALAGVVIAGLPNSIDTEPTIAIPVVSVAPTLSIAPADVATTVVATTEPVAEVAQTLPTAPATTTTTTTTTIAIEPDLARADVAVAAVNGAGLDGLATRVRNQLVDLGYTKASATDGTTIVEETTVYFFDGFESEAEQVLTALDLDPFRIAPVVLAPSFNSIDGVQVIVYLGRDSS